MLLTATVAVSAQMTDHNNNLQLYVGGGVHSMLYSPVEGNYHIGFGGVAGIQYQYMFNHHWGLGLGVEASSLAASAKYTYSIVDKQVMLPGATYFADVNTNLYNFREAQRAFLFSVPLENIFRAPISPKSAFQMGVGPASANTKSPTATTRARPTCPAPTSLTKICLHTTSANMLPTN